MQCAGLQNMTTWIDYTKLLQSFLLFSMSDRAGLHIREHAPTALRNFTASSFGCADIHTFLVACITQAAPLEDNIDDLNILLYQFLVFSSVAEGEHLHFKKPELITPITSRLKFWCRMAILVEAIDPQLRSICLAQTTNRMLDAPAFLHQHIVTDNLVSPFSRLCGAASWCFTMFSPPKVMITYLDDSASVVSINNKVVHLAAIKEMVRMNVPYFILKRIINYR